MIVEEYWTGIARRLQIESGVLHNLIPHATTKGTENELALARILERLVPPSIGVGSGVIFDHEGTTSAQTDVILYDKGTQPQLLAQTNQVMFPVETVRMAVEVKTTLSAKDISTDFLAKREKLNKLKVLDGFERPQFALFAYAFADSDFGRAEELAGTPEEGRPDLACVITPGFFLEVGQAGFVPLINIDGEQHATSRQAPESALASTLIDGTYYPVYMLGKYGGQKFVGDPGRALMLFCMSLLQSLGQDGAYDWIAAYLNPDIRLLQQPLVQ